MDIWYKPTFVSCRHHLLFAFLHVCLFVFFLSCLFAYLACLISSHTLCLPCLSRLSALCLFHTLFAYFPSVACLLVSCLCLCMYAYEARTRGVWRPLFIFLHLYFGPRSRDVDIYFPTLCACIVHDIWIYIPACPFPVWLSQSVSPKASDA